MIYNSSDQVKYTTVRSMSTLAIIPARSGSKGVAHKNIATFHGKPMIAHTIEQALAAESVDRVVVSTDSELYAGIARQFGAEVPFLRPAEFAEDLSTDLEVFQHALKWLDENESYRPEICVQLRPTYPTRRVSDIDEAVEMLKAAPEMDSVRTVIEAPHTPYKMWLLGEDDGTLSPIASCDSVKEAYNEPRQKLPKVFLQTANVDVAWTKTILEKGSMTGDRIKPMFTQSFNDIDDASELAQAAASVVTRMADKRFVFDIDGVIATLTPSNEYTQAEPMASTIGLINQLYDAGNYIILATARGSMTGIDWRPVTEQQMKDWGVKYHELHFGKPAGDYYVDDRFISLHDLADLVQRNGM